MQVGFEDNVCTVGRKRLQGRSQTFAIAVANVCGKHGLFWGILKVYRLDLPVERP